MSPWARIDDKVGSNRKFAGLDPAAIGLWTMGLVYCSNQLSDGAIPRASVYQLVASRRSRVEQLAGKLVKAGLWEETVDGWNVHDYLQWNDSADQVRARIAQARERKGRYRERYRDRSTGRFGATPGNASQDASGTRAGTHPGTRPETRSERVPEHRPREHRPNPIQSYNPPNPPTTGTRPPTPPPYLPGETDAQYARRVPLALRPADFGDGMHDRVLPDAPNPHAARRQP